MIGLLADAIHFRICHLHVYLTSQLLVAQLNQVYTMRDPHLFHQFLQARSLGRHFDTITFVHVPRSSNTYVDHIANIILDWNISHMYPPKKKKSSIYMIQS